MINTNDIKSKYGFDVVGIVKETSRNIIILGLETKLDRDLDEFIVSKSPRTPVFPGFKNHFAPKAKKLSKDIRNRGFKIYQERIRKFQIKKYAVMSGIGQQGKNTLIIHPVFDARLRFIALITNMPMEPSGTQTYEQEPNPRCEKCKNICVEECCEKVLEEYRLGDKTKCKAYKQLDDPTLGQIRCNICWKACEVS